jgi:hypothetical protein
MDFDHQASQVQWCHSSEEERKNGQVGHAAKFPVERMDASVTECNNKNDKKRKTARAT